MSDEIIEAAKNAAHAFRTRLTEINSAKALREFVSDFFCTQSEKEFWLELASLWEMKGYDGWARPAFLAVFPALAYEQWALSCSRFADERAKLGFMLGSENR